MPTAVGFYDCIHFQVSTPGRLVFPAMFHGRKNLQTAIFSNPKVVKAKVLERRIFFSMDLSRKVSPAVFCPGLGWLISFELCLIDVYWFNIHFVFFVAGCLSPQGWNQGRRGKLIICFLFLPKPNTASAGQSGAKKVLKKFDWAYSSFNDYGTELICTTWDDVLVDCNDGRLGGKVLLWLWYEKFH